MVLVLSLNLENYPVESYNPKQYYLWLISIEKAWRVTKGSPEIIIAVIDTGIDFNHTALINAAWVNPNETINGVDDDGNGYIDDIHGWDFRDNDSYPEADYWQGTFVAGLIAGDSNDFSGVAPGVKIMSLRFLDENSRFYDSDWPKLIAAIEYAVKSGASVINLSFKAYGSPPSSVHTAIIEAYSAGVNLVSITGGDGGEYVTYPGNYSEVIAVSAIDENLDRYHDSNFGEVNEICAPGVNIYSIEPSEGRRYASGTYYAAPLVSGTIGLMLSANRSLLPQDIREILRDSSYDIGVRGKDIFFGNGLLNASTALSLSLSQETTTTRTISESPTINSTTYSPTTNSTTYFFPLLVPVGFLYLVIVSKIRKKIKKV